MPSPFLPINSLDGGPARHIDNQYALQLIADNKQMLEYQAESLCLQRETARANLEAMSRVERVNQETTDLLRDANTSLASMVEGVQQMGDSLDELRKGVGTLSAAVSAQTHVLYAALSEVVRVLGEQQQTLHKIADVLQHPYDTQAIELLREAERALKEGISSSGREQDDNYKDAMQLFSQVLANPIGKRNYVAWFNTGWLQWKWRRDVSQALEAFYHASRISAHNADMYHANSLSHMAYMYYLQNGYADAYDTIHKALRVAPDDHDIRYDAARYAARTGRHQEAIALLEHCIDQRPQTIVTMFSETDFLQ